MNRTDMIKCITVALFLVVLAMAPTLGAMIANSAGPKACDSDGKYVKVFSDDADIYVKADSGVLKADACYLVWVQGVLRDDFDKGLTEPNQWINGHALDPGRDPTGVVEIVHTDSKGGLEPTLIWEQSESGTYLIVLDGGDEYGVVYVGGYRFGGEESGVSEFRNSLDDCHTLFTVVGST